MKNRNPERDITIDGVEIKESERQPTEIWTRVMGYFRPVSMYNTGKKGEFHERVEFEEPRGQQMESFDQVQGSGGSK